MKPLGIDFADEQRAWRRDLRMPATRLALLIALVAAIALGMAWREAGALTEQRLLLDARLARLVVQQAQAERRQRSLQASGEQLELLRKAAAQRALPWEAVFRAFESAPDVRLESWAPDLANGVVKVQAHAPDMARMQDYLARLQGSAVFTRVSLLRHELPPQGAGVNFNYEAVLAAPYRLPDTPARSAR